MSVLLGIASASLLLGLFLSTAGAAWITSARPLENWRIFRRLPAPFALVVEYAAIAFLWGLFFYCFSNISDPLSWVILLPTSVITLIFGARWVWYRYVPNKLVWRFASYQESGRLNEKNLLDAADALTAPSDFVKAEAQAQQLRAMVASIEPNVIIPVMNDAQAQIAYLQSRVLAHVLKQEGGALPPETPKLNNPEAQAILELARHKRALRNIPTQLVKEDVREMRELYDELSGLGRAGQEFTKMTEQISGRSGIHQEKRKPAAEEIAHRIFVEASRDSRIRSYAGKLFKEAEAKLLQDAAEGRRSEEEVRREIENLRDLLNRKLEENEE